MTKPKGRKIGDDDVAIVLPLFGLVGREGKSTSLISWEFIAKGEVESKFATSFLIIKSDKKTVGTAVSRGMVHKTSF